MASHTENMERVDKVLSVAVAKCVRERKVSIAEATRRHLAALEAEYPTVYAAYVRYTAERYAEEQRQALAILSK